MGGVCSYLEKFLPQGTKTIVDVAAGYCDFINHIAFQCRKYAIDINPDVEKYAADDVETFVDDIINMAQHFEKGSVSIFFMSNFLEHICKEDIRALLEIGRAHV